MADDVAISFELSRSWSEDQVREYFESGGTVMPTGGAGAGSGSGETEPPVQADGVQGEDVLVVPLFSWYDYAWDEEPEVEAHDVQAALTGAMDFHRCQWPAQLADYSPLGSQHPPTGALARWFGRLNERALQELQQTSALEQEAPPRAPPMRRMSGRSTFRLYHGEAAMVHEVKRFLADVDLETFCTRRVDGRRWQQSYELDEPSDAEWMAQPQLRSPCPRRRHRGPFVLSCSHFLPRQELLPEKRLLKFPALAKIAGSSTLAEQVARLAPDVHVFGHTHVPWDMTIDGIRYMQWPLGTPREHAEPSVKGTGLVGTFCKIYDSREGGEAPEHFTAFGAHYAEFKRDLSKRQKAPYVPA